MVERFAPTISAVWMPFGKALTWPPVAGACATSFSRFLVSIREKFPFGGERDSDSGSQVGASETAELAPGADDLAAELTQRYWHRLRLFAARRLRDRNAAEDVAQETLRRALEALRDGRVQNLVALPAFLFKTAQNICMHRARSAAREAKAFGRFGQDPQGAVSVDPADPLTALIGEERRAQVRDALGSLAESDRELLRMIYGEVMTPAEIARTLGTNMVALRARKHRALQRLAAFLGKGSTGHDASPEGT
jgi:RNA polymerase sigma-70 factor, ECF subfamily